MSVRISGPASEDGRLPPAHAESTPASPLETLAREQGVSPVCDVEELRGEAIGAAS
ncbi:hypothetical protein [Streptosporangium saharense]|uniref:hypothetical protein n=1 Tax=Streptosporangium saharense TaxID=1706840 RepID=UPI0033328B32